jgi:hypothetical protein
MDKRKKAEQHTHEGDNEPTQAELLAAVHNNPNKGNQVPPPPDEPPEITSLEPDNATIGSPSFTLYIHGTGFTPGSVIVFAGHDEPTTVDPDGVVSTGINMPLWTGPDKVDVYVRNGAARSNLMLFTFAEAAPELDAAEVADADAEDELEEDIEEAVEEGAAKKVHRPGKTKNRSGKR